MKRKSVPHSNAVDFFNNLANPGIKEELERGRLRFEDEKRKDEEHRDKMVIEERRGKNLVSHWLDRIIQQAFIDDREHCEIKLDAMGVRPFYFPERIMARKLLVKLQDANCIRGWEDHRDCFVLRSPNIPEIQAYKDNFDLQLPLNQKNKVKTSEPKKKDLIIFLAEDLEITLNGQGFFVNGEFVRGLHRGSIPMKICRFAYENETLIVPYEEFEKLGLKQEEVTASVNKTFRGDLFKTIKEHCIKKNCDLPDDFFEGLLRPVTGEGYALFHTKVR